MEGEGREVWSEREKGRVTDGGRETPKRGCDDGGKVRLPPPQLPAFYFQWTDQRALTC